MTNDRLQTTIAPQNMAIVYYILLFCLMLVGVAITIMTLPGLWLILASAGLYAWLTHGVFIGWKTLGVLLVMAGLGEVVELSFSATGARQSGAGKRGTWGALIGGLLGGLFLTALVPIPIVGTLIGVCIGTFLGAMIGELSGGREAAHSAFVGIGAAKGRLMGTLAKVAIGGVMFVVTLWVGFPHHPPSALAGPPPAVSPATQP